MNKKSQSKKPFNKFTKGHKYNRQYNIFNQKNPENKDSKSTKKLTNDDDCPIHGPSHKWGQCHQNQYGDKFRPRKSGATSHAGASQDRNSRSSFHNGPPNQVQVFSNERLVPNDYR